MGYMNIKKKDGDILFGVRSNFIDLDGNPKYVSDTQDYIQGPYTTLAGARKSYNQHVKTFESMKGNDYYKRFYSGYKVEIVATKVDWQVMETISNSY